MASNGNDCLTVGLHISYGEAILTNYLAIGRIKKAKLGWDGVKNNWLELKTNKKANNNSKMAK